MISQIKFKNFKLFKKEQTLEFKPITILIGKNNTGKSAVLKLPTLIEGALNSKSPAPINLENKGILQGNRFIDLVYGKFGRAIELELKQENNIEGDFSTLISHIIIDNTTDKPILEYWKLNDEIELQKVEDNVYTNELTNEEYTCYFNGILLDTLSCKTNRDINTPSLSFTLNTDFIGAVREQPRPFYQFSLTKTEESGIDGSKLYNFLIEDYLTTDKKYFNQINKWFSSKFEGWSIYIDVDNEPFHIELRKGSLHINLSQTGMGIGQSLPLISRAFKPCKEETLIIVEEPESHLHPYAHAEIAQLFVDSLANDKNKKYFIETHSLNFVLRIRRLVAEGKLKKEDLGIYYVDFKEETNESILEKINVDDGGGVVNWPEGVFSETTKETRAIYNAQLNDINNVDRN